MDSKHIARLVLLNKAFIGSLVLFIVNELLLHEYEFLLVNSYLNDIIAPIIILTITQFVLSIYKKRLFTLSIGQLIVFFLYISFVFEWLLPSYSLMYTSDVYDLLAYLIGVLIFYIFINSKLNEHNTNNYKQKKC